jgi:hypothetical protein
MLLAAATPEGHWGTDHDQTYRGSLFLLDRLCPCPGALRALGGEGTGVDELLQRHVTDDSGDLSEDEKRANDVSVTEGIRILSAYSLPRTGARPRSSSRPASVNVKVDTDVVPVNWRPLRVTASGVLL